MAVTYFPGSKMFNPKGTFKKLMRKLGVSLSLKNLSYKAGAPTTDVDIAYANGDICWDTSNSDLYIASNTNAPTLSTTTWTKFAG